MSRIKIKNFGPVKNGFVDGEWMGAKWIKDAEEQLRSTISYILCIENRIRL